MGAARRCLSNPSLLALAAALGLAWLPGVTPARGQAPQLVSTTPPDQATDVPTRAPLVFTFDRDMNTTIPVVSSLPGLFVGNIEFEPPIGILVEGTWSGNQRVLTCVPLDSWPPNTTITWRLNPPGTLLALTSAAGIPLVTVSGSFTTGGSGGGGAEPILLATIPANGAAGVAVTTSVQFLFDQPMQTNTAVADAFRWLGTGLEPARFTYTWSGDGRTLTADYAGDLPPLTPITWLLNWSGTTRPLTSTAGVPLPADTYSGVFTTGTAGGGGEDCQPDGIPASWGAYNLVKSAAHQQTSAAAPLPVAEEPFHFTVFVSSPRNGPQITAASITPPGGAPQNLTAAPFGGFLAFNQSFTQPAALDAAFPAGTYLLRFTQSGQPERQINLPLPASAPPVPQIANHNAAQAVNPAQDFTLRWNAFTGATAQDGLSLVVTETNLTGGTVVFQAPDFCVPRELPPTATSVVIPAGTLKSNRTYQATLTFFKQGYSSTNAVPEMAGAAGVVRSTDFTLRTVGGGTPAQPAQFTGYRLLPDGRLELTLAGTPAQPYTLQRATSLATRDWSPAATVTPDVTGRAVFVEPAGGLPVPRFYRAVTP